jgi:hypothetical protein
MADYQALATELDLPEYAGLDDQAAADHYNSKVATVDRSTLDVGMLQRWGMASGARKAIENNANHVDPVIASICLGLKDYLIGRGGSIDLSEDSDDLEMVDALVAAGVWTEAMRTSLLGLRSVQVPYYQTTGFNLPATARDVAHARSL